MAALQAFDWTASNVKRFAVLHTLTARKAFEDGVRCQQELPQSTFLARNLRALFQAGREASTVIEESDWPADAGDTPVERLPSIRVSRKADPPLKVPAERKGEFFDRGFAVEDRAEFTTELFLSAVAAEVRARLVQLRSIWCAIEQFCLSRLNLRLKSF